MKVKMPKNYRQKFTLEEHEIAKRIIKDMKEDESTVKEYLEYACNEVLKDKDWTEEILKAEATTERNGRIWDAYGEGTNNMDVWIEGVARTGHGFLIIGAYLTDIWNTGSTPYAEHCFVKRFIEA